MVNSKNLIISESQKNLPYLETINFITKTSEKLIRSGDSQFIDFLHIQNRSSEYLNTGDVKTAIENFDFSLGIPLARQLSSISMLKMTQECVNELEQYVRFLLAQKAGLNINRITEKPAMSVKAVRSFLFLEQIPSHNSSEFDKFETIRQQIFKEQALPQFNKSDLKAPLNSWDEDKITILFFRAVTQIELILLSLLNSFSTLEKETNIEINFLKENIFQIKTTEIYENIIKILNNIIPLIEKYAVNIVKKEPEIKKYENESFIERIGFHLSALNENKDNIQTLQGKMRLLLLNDNIKFDELIDDEIHNINTVISKENINIARLQMRLNDTEYPLSVAYRNYVKSQLQYLGE